MRRYEEGEDSMKNRMHIQHFIITTLLVSLLGCQDEAPAQQSSVQQTVTTQTAVLATKPSAPKTDAGRIETSAETRPAQSIPVAVQSAQSPPASTTNESGTALKADDIKAEPFNDAKTVGNLAPDDKVEILKREGGWLQINSKKAKGWVRMLSIRKGEAAKKSSAGGVLGLASGRAGTGKVVATTGIRGLNEEELKSAKFNEAEVQLAESYASSKPEAAGFAAQGKLAARPFAYLAAPK